MIAYFDTSAFVKLVVPEHGSDRVAAIWADAVQRTSSRLLYPETRATLARAARAGRLNGVQTRRAVSAVDELLSDVDEIDVTRARTRRAGELAARYGLRAHDAVHLASLESIADEHTLLVAAEGELLAAAGELGVATAAVVA